LKSLSEMRGKERLPALKERGKKRTPPVPRETPGENDEEKAVTAICFIGRNA